MAEGGLGFNPYYYRLGYRMVDVEQTCASAYGLPLAGIVHGAGSLRAAATLQQKDEYIAFLVAAAKAAGPDGMGPMEGVVPPWDTSG